MFPCAILLQQAQKNGFVFLVIEFFYGPFEIKLAFDSSAKKSRISVLDQVLLSTFIIKIDKGEI